MPPKKRRRLSSTFEEGMSLPTLTGRTDSRLKLSVITSSNEYIEIADLLAELWALRVFAIDFYPRGLDIQKALKLERLGLESKTLLERFSDDESDDFVRRLAQHVNREKKRSAKIIEDTYGTKTSKDTFQIPALATFFPEISSFNPDRARQAGKALVGAVKLAQKLGAKVVEFVVGRTIERCHEAPIGYPSTRLLCDFIHMSEPEERIEKVIEVLKDVVVEKVPKVLDDGYVKLAAEIEPGYSFILNSPKTVNHFLGGLKEAGILEGVGLNLDIGHALILSESDKDTNGENISPDAAAHWIDNIFHAHVSDNIGYHFRDLVPGQFHYLLESDGEQTFRRWIEFCAECSERNKNFTGYLALELEACGRIQWIHRSLVRLGYTIRDVLK